MSKLANELALIRHMIDVGYPRKHAKNHIPSLLLDHYQVSPCNFLSHYQVSIKSRHVTF